MQVSYATVGSNDIGRALGFYDQLLEPFGIRGMFEHFSGGRIYGKDGRIMFGLVGPFNGEPATVGNGTMIAFRCSDPQEVAAVHRRALELGGTTEGDPGERAPDMHFAYFRDLDGNKLCAFAFSRLDEDALARLAAQPDLLNASEDG